MKNILAPILLALALALSGAAFAQDEVKLPRSPSPKGAKAYVVFPKTGKSVRPKFKVVFGLKGMGIAPSGIKQENTGHHHLLIDVPEDKMPAMGMPLAATESIRHFGGGQTEVMLELPEGKHTLQLILADHLHIPHDPPVVSERISITVMAPDKK